MTILITAAQAAKNVFNAKLNKAKIRETEARHAKFEFSYAEIAASLHAVLRLIEEKSLNGENELVIDDYLLYEDEEEEDKGIPFKTIWTSENPAFLKVKKELEILGFKVIFEEIHSNDGKENQVIISW